MPKRVDDQTLIQLIETHGLEKAAVILEMNSRDLRRKRRRLEQKYNRPVNSPHPNNTSKHLQSYPHRIETELRNGHILIGSDSHYWPDIITTAHRAFVAFNKEYKPKIVIKNGDVIDGASISRHPPIGWESCPTVKEELETVGERLKEITEANKNAQYIWPLGNHDARYETRLATVASEYAKVHGFHLKDHFPRWKPCWSVFVNNDIVIKHRFKGGIHATHNNTLTSGRTMITGHLHSLKVTPYSDYNGTRYGVDTGTMADPNGDQFVHYTEDSPKNWRSGFVMLTIKDNFLLWPEVIHVIDEQRGLVQFRGEIIAV